MAYGAFWLTYAYTLDPAYLAYGAYSPDPTNPALGLTSTGFNASYGKFEEHQKESGDSRLLTNRRILPSVHGPAQPNFPHLLIEDGHHPRNSILNLGPRLWSSHWTALQHRIGQRCSRRRVTIRTFPNLILGITSLTTM